jgi:hypothetical protein
MSYAFGTPFITQGELILGEYYEKHEPPFFMDLTTKFKPLTVNKEAYDRPDQDVLADVLDRFAGLYGIETHMVDTKVEAGVVTLSGAVGTSEQRTFLGAVASNVLGVRAVDNHLAVAKAGGAAT